MIIFSDGEDNSSAHHRLDAIEAAQSNDVALSCLRYTENRYELAYHTSNPSGDKTFHKISIRTRQPSLEVRAKTGYYAR